MKIGLLLGLSGLGTAVAVCGAAILWGGGRERRAGIVTGLSWLGSFAVQQLGHRLDPNLSFLVIDIAALIALAGPVWRSGQVWPIFAVMFQALAAAIDGVRLIAPGMHRWAYLTGLAMAAYGLLGVIAIATLQAIRRRRSAEA